MTIESSPLETQWVNGFEYADMAAKLKTAWMVDDGPSELAIVVDWDGVVTAKHYDGISGTSWGVLRRHMTPANQAEHARLYAYYGPLEKEGLLTPEESEVWQRQAMKLLIGCSMSAIEADARRTTQLQPGVEQLFRLQVPIFVKSSGVAQVIAAIADHYNISPTKSFANEFEVENDIITGVDESSITHSHNKHTHSHLTVAEYAMHKHVIVIGDNLHDTQMIDLDTNDLTLRIRVGEGRHNYIQQHTPEDWQTHIRQSFNAGYDMIAIDEGMPAIAGLAKEIIEPRHGFLAAA